MQLLGLSPFVDLGASVRLESAVALGCCFFPLFGNRNRMLLYKDNIVVAFVELPTSGYAVAYVNGRESDRVARLILRSRVSSFPNSYPRERVVGWAKPLLNINKIERMANIANARMRAKTRKENALAKLTCLLTSLSISQLPLQSG